MYHSKLIIKGFNVCVLYCCVGVFKYDFNYVHVSKLQSKNKEIKK